MGRSSRHRVPWVALVAALMALAPLVPGARASYPTLPLADDGQFLRDLAAPVLAPGETGAITFTVADPLAADLMFTDVSFDLYAFNAYPGNATQSVPTGALDLVSTNPPGSSGSIAIGTIVPGAPVSESIPMEASAAAPSGTYAIWFTLDFLANGTVYHLASRGTFSDALWAAATTGPNGTSTLDLARLNVSGILPETGVLVRSNPFPVALTVVLIAALALAGAGGYYAFRRGPASRSGATTPDEPSQAPTAFGNRRSRDGD